MPFYTLTGGNTDKIPGRIGRKGLVVIMNTAGPAVYAGETPIGANEGISFTQGVPVSFFSPDNKVFAAPLPVKGTIGVQLYYTEFL